MSRHTVSRDRTSLLPRATGTIVRRGTPADESQGSARCRPARRGPGPIGGGSLFGLAVRHHQAGRLAEAGALYRQVLAGDRNHFGSLHHLGIIALQRGQPQAAIEPIGRADRDRRPQPGMSLQHRFRIPVARTAERRHPPLPGRRSGSSPTTSMRYSNLANVLLQTGRHAAKRSPAYERVIALRPTAETHCNLANMLARIGRLDDAVQQFQRALDAQARPRRRP